MTRVRFSKDGSVCYVPPAPGDAVEAFIEKAAAEFKKTGPRMTLRGGLTLEAMRAAREREERQGPPQSGVVKVLGINIGGVK